MNGTDLYLEVRGAAARIKLAASTLAKMRTYGNGPRYAKVGGKILYKVSDLDTWIESRFIHSTADTPIGHSLSRKPTNYQKKQPQSAQQSAQSGTAGSAPPASLDISVNRDPSDP
ncbi:MAG: helix-turn-helix domain-containing protein [Magnetococcales bacterium]|nr:helix-turn-helix domain-containing protein [Magnetococcales bacterium]